MTHSEPEDPPLESAEGVDLTVVRWLLDQSPAERLRRLEESIRSLRELAHGAEQR